MEKIFSYIKLIRVKHWIKNFFVFIPLFFSKNIFVYSKLNETLKVFLLFSLASSVIYIINDICDIEKDRKHPKKRNRPLANGSVSISEAKKLIVIFLLLILSTIYFTNKVAVLVVITYIVMNILYSIELKHKPILDVMIIALGFIFRVMAGGISAGVELSSWLLLTIFSLSIFLGFGKRRNELMYVTENDRRKVLEFYDIEFLNNFTNIFSGMFIIFYCLYTFEKVNTYFYITIPFITYGVLKYNLLLKNVDNEGDPTEILLNDRGIRGVVFLYCITVFILLYLN